ncbi:hypothetical protein ABK040_010498 [Willaertia magna]
MGLKISKISSADFAIDIPKNYVSNIPIYYHYISKVENSSSNSVWDTTYSIDESMINKYNLERKTTKLTIQVI